MSNKRKFTHPQVQNSIAPGILPGIKPQDLKPIACNNCKGLHFSPVGGIAEASRFQSRTGLPTIVNFPIGFVCITCKKINPFKIEGITPPKEPKKPEEEGKDLSINASDGIKTAEKLN